VQAGRIRASSGRPCWRLSHFDRDQSLHSQWCADSLHAHHLTELPDSLFLQNLLPSRVVLSMRGQHTTLEQAMRILNIAILIVGLSVAVAANSGGAAQNDDPAAITFKDVNGRAQTPLALGDKKATVLFFLLPECPVSNSYAPEIQRICAAYEAKKITAFVVHADPDVTIEQAKKHAKEFGLACPVLLDPFHVLAKKAGVKMAPEVAVLGPECKVLYRGRIDDWYAGYGKRRAEPTQRDLRNALDSILDGKAVATPTTKVIGCYLPEAKK
jgi:hypothetical protein